ncbi:MAG: oligosaccharide flippase family protein [Paracoccaceae bacterium]
MSAIRAGAWTAGSRVLAHAGQFAVFLVAVRVLSAAEFGIFAMVAAWVVILSQFSQAGWPEYVMQWTGPERRLQQVLSVSLGLGILLGLVGVGSGWLFLLEDQTTGHLIWVLALTIPLASLGSAYAGVLNLRDRLIAAAAASSLGEVANMTVSILALLNDQGVLALAYGRLAGILTWLVASFLMVRLLPDPRVTMAEFRQIFSFAWRIIAVRLLMNLRLYAATLVIGFYLGATDAGYFRAGQRLVGALSEVLGEPTRVLSWSLFRPARQQPDGSDKGFGPTATRFFSALLAISVPLFLLLLVHAEDLVMVVLGPNWLPTVPVVQILALAYLLYAPGTANEAILSLAGQVRLLPYLVSAYAAVGLVLTVLAARMGLQATAWAQVLVALIILLNTAYVHRRYAGIHWSAIMRDLWRVPIATVVMLIVNQGAAMVGWVAALPPAPRMVLCSILALLAYGLVMVLLDRNLADRLRRRLGGRGQ